jgi:hypothetical protein
MTSERPEIAVKIGATDVPEEVEKINALFFGESKVGKTHLVGTAGQHPDLAPMLYLDLEGGNATLRGFPGIEYVRIKSIKQLTGIQNELFKDSSGYYKSVALDGLTELQDLDMREIMKLLIREKPERDEEVPDKREWGKSRWHMRDIVRSFRDLPNPTNLFCTALLHELEEEGKASRFVPNLPGKQRGEIPGFMDIVGYYRKETNKRILQLEGTRRVLAGSRFSELGSSIDDPDLPTIWKLITGELSNVTFAKPDGK